jgi:hypothetical protein
MIITLDVARRADLTSDQVELTLVEQGQQIEVLRRTQVTPVARVRLPHRCEDVVDWTLNNGVLDITLRLVPVGDLPSVDDNEDPDELNDDEPNTFEDGTIAIDLSEDEDDDDDDGGIPIL